MVLKIAKTLNYGRVCFYLQKKMGITNSQFAAVSKTFAKEKEIWDFSTFTVLSTKHFLPTLKPNAH
jgi:hypothetical protein